MEEVTRKERLIELIKAVMWFCIKNEKQPSPSCDLFLMIFVNPIINGSKDEEL